MANVWFVYFFRYVLVTQLFKNLLHMEDLTLPRFMDGTKTMDMCKLQCLILPWAIGFDMRYYAALRYDTNNITGFFRYYSASPPGHPDSLHLYRIYALSEKNGKDVASLAGSTEPECLSCGLTFLANETEAEISLFLRKHSSVTGKIEWWTIFKNSCQLKCFFLQNDIITYADWTRK